MFVGVARIVLQIPGSRSLKDRRRVVRSFKDKVRARFPAAIAEVGDVEAWQIATLGVAVVSADAAHCDELLGNVVSLGRTLPEALLADVRTEVVPFGRGGDSLRRGLESMADLEDEDG